MNIYVGNLSWSATESELQTLFEAHGTVSSVAIIKDKYSGQSRGFGFIEMPNDAEGNDAINALNGQDFGGRNLKVNVARPREDRRDDRRRGRRSNW